MERRAGFSSIPASRYRPQMVRALVAAMKEHVEAGG
jgi:hypothetical protein